MTLQVGKIELSQRSDWWFKERIKDINAENVQLKNVAISWKTKAMKWSKENARLRKIIKKAIIHLENEPRNPYCKLDLFNILNEMKEKNEQKRV